MRPRRGLTLVELLISMTVLAIIMAAAVGYFRQQLAQLSMSAGRSTALQTAEFVGNAIDRDLRVAGAGVLQTQPMLVYADAQAITFNADLVSNQPGDIAAVATDSDIDAAATGGLTQTITLPLNGGSYPLTTYQTAAGVAAPAQTISYYIAPDSTSTLANAAVMMRRVNADSAQVVADGLIVPPEAVVFSYLIKDTLNANQLDSVGSGQSAMSAYNVPLVHVAVHGSATDTGASGVIDFIRVVHVHLISRYHDTRHNRDVTDTVMRSIRPLNAGLINNPSCGLQPIAVASATAVLATISGLPTVTVTFPASADQTGGQHSVDRYLVYRRRSDSTFVAPFYTTPAVATTYTITDTSMPAVAGFAYYYGIIAQDCSPTNSPMASSNGVVLP
jgi:prepilin-type N-terminal cleavage/methylation domain-containing protein